MSSPIARHQRFALQLDRLYVSAGGVERHPDTHVLFLTKVCDEDIVVSALLAGAHGYVLKSSDPAQLLTHIRTVACGGSVLDAAANEIVVDWMRRAALVPHSADRITEHERRILPLIAEGKTNREIAAALYLSEHTIKSYVSALLKKLQLARRAEAAAYVARLEHAQSV